MHGAAAVAAIELINVVQQRLAALLLSSAVAVAQINTVQTVAPDVYFHAGDPRRGHSNNGWIVFDDFVLVIDAIDLPSETTMHRYNSVRAFVASLEAAVPAAFAAMKVAQERIDLTTHQGEHPRIGATDVVPFIPLEGATMEHCVALARELGSRNITVNCVAPGFIATDMTASLPEEQHKALLGQIPLGHLGQPDDIAHAVAYLAGPGAGYVTGQELHVNGGMFMA